MFSIQIVDDIRGRQKRHSTLNVIQGRRAREGGEGVRHEAVTIKAIVLVANEAAPVNYLNTERPSDVAGAH
jgi:hypothetical protein